jgi:hypothetical protein
MTDFSSRAMPHSSQRPNFGLLPSRLKIKAVWVCGFGIEAMPRVAGNDDLVA